MLKNSVLTLPALEVRDKAPKKVISDKHASYPKAIDMELGKKVEYTTIKYLNNYMEQDHPCIKARIKPILGFKKYKSAERFCRAFDEQRHYFRYREFKHDPVLPSRQRQLFKSRVAYIQKKFEAAARICINLCTPIPLTLFRFSA